MPSIRTFLDSILDSALVSLASSPVDVFTFAFYHDHESRAVSICIDTRESSDRHVPTSNSWSMKYFSQHISAGRLDDARLFQANPGRNLSLGDFAAVNLARKDIPRGLSLDAAFYIEMAKAIISRQQDILGLSSTPDLVIFCCSGPEAEIDLVWSAVHAQSS